MVMQNNKNQWLVSDEFNNHRIDYWLKKQLSFISYPILCKLLRKGVVRVNGRRAKNSLLLKTGDSIKFSRNIKNTSSETIKEKYNQKFSIFINKLIIHKDEFSISINKPSGLAVQGGTRIKLNIDLMLDSLKFNLVERPKLVHRIDKETSGVLLIARTLKSSRYYGDLFKRRLIEKVYITITKGCPKYKKGKITLPVGNEKKLESITYYNVIDSSKDLSLLIVKPITGRKHQIREHLSYIGNNIYGDDKYKKINENLETKYLHLHAYSLKFLEQNGKVKQIDAELPDYFKTTIETNGLKRDFLKENLYFGDLESYQLID